MSTSSTSPAPKRIFIPKEEETMPKLAATVAVALALMSGATMAQTTKPMIVLVHGAFADSSSWNGVMSEL
jgi:hypothetical protein